jgi:hypothetical protein
MSKLLKKQITILFLFAFLTSAWPLFGQAQDNLCLLRGFVYGDDGKKPLTDAVVLIREITTEKIYHSEKTKKNGTYRIQNLLPGTYAVGIQYKGNEYNVDALVLIKPKKQMACFTLPKIEEKPGYQVRCKSPKCFFITPVGWALAAAATAGITYVFTKIVEKQVSPIGI